MKPKLSIIIPVYNAGKYIKASVESVLSQTLKEIEIICINDGSADDSLKILKELQEIDHRVIVLDQVNQGVSAARNAGLEIAKGEYIGFVDADDKINPDYFENFINAGDDDVITTLLHGSLDLQLNVSYGKKEIQEIIFPMMLSEDRLNSCCTKVFKNEIIQKYKLRFPLGQKLGEDAHFIMSFLQYAEDFRYINNPGYHYLENEESATRAVKNEDFFKRIFQEFNFDHQRIYHLDISETIIAELKALRLVNAFIANLSMYLRYSPYLSKKTRVDLVKKYTKRLQETQVLSLHKDFLLQHTHGFNLKILKGLIQNNFFFIYWAYQYSHWRNHIR